MPLTKDVCEQGNPGPLAQLRMKTARDHEIHLGNESALVRGQLADSV